MIKQESEHMYLQFRRTIEKSAWILFVIVFLMECIIGYIWIHNNWLIDGDTPSLYCLKYIFVPTLINFTAIVCYHYSEYHTKLPTSTKNYFLLLTFTVMCLSLSMTHNAVRAAPLSFVLPVFLSAIFGDFQTTKKCFAIDFFLYLCCSFFIYLLMAEDKRFLVLDQLAGCIIMIASYLITRSIIRYEQRTKNQLIHYNEKQSQLIEQLKLDALTGLYNHNTFYNLLDAAMIRAHSHNSTLILAILDIDDFKKVNDTYGHSNGDIVLLELAKLLKNCSKDKVLSARYGGEEFCLLFEHHSLTEAMQICEQVREQFATLQMKAIGSNSVTFSAGMVAYTPEYETTTAMFDRADEALYQAKAEGKNKVVVYTEKII